MTTTESTTMIVHPGTGEAIDLATATTTDLAGRMEELSELLSDLGAFRRALINELAGRLDAAGRRSATVGEFTIATNAPTEEIVDVATLREALEQLVDERVITRDAIDAVIVTPDPKPPAPRVDKRALNVLRRTDNSQLADAIDQATSRAKTNRTIKIERIPSR